MGAARSSTSLDPRGTIIAALAPAAAIFVFGVIYGSLAKPLIGTVGTILSSLVIFSGSVQFTIIALLSSGAGTAAVLAGAGALNLRNLVLGAVMRPRVTGSPLTRAGLGWFLTDEAAGLALAVERGAGRILVIAGSMFYVAWQLGTAVGLLGASVESLQEAASAVFPVLFVGLAAAVCPSWGVAVRAAVAAAVVGAVSWLWPGSQGLAAVIVAVVVAIPGGDR